MAKAPPRTVVVQGSERISPNMLRLRFGGDALNDFPAGHEGGYIKLIFPDQPRIKPERPVMRTYSVRAHDAAAATIDVDFALHGETGGIATDWALNARPGDQIAIGGPGSVKMVNPDADWVLLAGDMTAMPALMCNLDRLTETSIGHVVIEVTSEADKPKLTLPKGVNIHWVVTPRPDQAQGHLVDAIRALPWLDGDPFVWTACEFDSMRALRSYYRTERGVARDQIYLSSYWRAGCTEDQHKAAKQQDSIASAA